MWGRLVWPLVFYTIVNRISTKVLQGSVRCRRLFEKRFWGRKTGRSRIWCSCIGFRDTAMNNCILVGAFSIIRNCLNLSTVREKKEIIGTWFSSCARSFRQNTGLLPRRIFYIPWLLYSSGEASILSHLILSPTTLFPSILSLLNALPSQISPYLPPFRLQSTIIMLSIIYLKITLMFFSMQCRKVASQYRIWVLDKI